MSRPAGGHGKKVLIVEDERAMAVALRDGFALEGYEVLAAPDGLQGLAMAEERLPDIIILDVMLPKLSGLDVCRSLRSQGNQIPIIMLTARGQEVDRILGLKLGADDYVTKPFSLLELVTRVEAVLRRISGHDGESDPTSCCFGKIRVDFQRHRAEKDGRELNLSSREFLLLHFFYKRRGKVVSRDELLDVVWGYDSIPFTRTVDTHVAKLRKKIEEDPAHPRFLLTVHRLGYKFTG